MLNLPVLAKLWPGNHSSRKSWWPSILLILLGIIWALGLHSLFFAQPIQAEFSSALAPEARIHPLPPALQQWLPAQSEDDYFDQVKPTRVGYLVWSQLPVKVWIEPVSGGTGQEKWQAAARQGIKDWQVYFPLEITLVAEQADIAIAPISPSQLGQARIRSGETHYRLYVDDQNRLAHRCTIQVRANQTQLYMTAAVRHELGHALGIWGHSPVAADALYFSQVRHPAPISTRDLNTLKRVYQQPTRLGWPVGGS